MNNQLTTVTIYCSLVFSSACSTDESVPSDEPIHVEKAPLTETQFTSEGNRICREMINEQLLLSNSKDHKAGNSIELHRQGRNIRTKHWEALFLLNPPPSFQPDFIELREIVRDWRASTSPRSVPEPDINHRLGPRRREAITNLGLTDCL